MLAKYHGLAYGETHPSLESPASLAAREPRAGETWRQGAHHGCCPFGQARAEILEASGGWVLYRPEGSRESESRPLAEFMALHRRAAPRGLDPRADLAPGQLWTPREARANPFAADEGEPRRVAVTRCEEEWVEYRAGRGRLEALPREAFLRLHAPVGASRMASAELLARSLGQIEMPEESAAAELGGSALAKLAQMAELAEGARRTEIMGGAQMEGALIAAPAAAPALADSAAAEGEALPEAVSAA